MSLKLAAYLKAIVDRTTSVHKIVDTIDTWNESEKESFVNESFFELIKYSSQNVPYYKRIMQEHNFSVGAFTRIEDVKKLPILTKDLVRSNYDQLRSTELSNMKYTSRRSGGTTGEPIRALISKRAAAFETFCYFKGLKWIGWNPNMTMVKLFAGSLGVGPADGFRDWVYQKAVGSISVPAFELNKESIVKYHEILSGKKEICFLGYASAIDNFVNLLREQNLILGNVKLAITTSEQLAEEWRTNIVQYFQCEVRSYYGCGEIESLGYQLYKGNDSYRIPFEHCFIESDSINNELYVTQLHNIAQPMIRFANGDIGVIDSSVKPRYINKLIGRTSDYFLRKNGEKVSPNFGAHSILRSEIPVKQYQYIQYKNHIIEFRYIMESGQLTKEHKETINNIVNYVMNEPTQLIFSENKPFETSASRKHRICVTIDTDFV